MNPTTPISRRVPRRGGGSWRPLLVCGLAPLFALALAGHALATHRTDHRFIVIGFVTDAAGRPLAGRSVVVTRVKTGLTYSTRTEGDGVYLVVVHLHDEDEGERLEVGANGVTREIRASFDPTNHRVERGTRLDIQGTSASEDRRAFAETLRAYLER